MYKKKNIFPIQQSMNVLPSCVLWPVHTVLWLMRMGVRHVNALDVRFLCVLICVNLDISSPIKAVKLATASQVRDIATKKQKLIPPENRFLGTNFPSRTTRKSIPRNRIS